MKGPFQKRFLISEVVEEYYIFKKINDFSQIDASLKDLKSKGRYFFLK